MQEVTVVKESVKEISSRLTTVVNELMTLDGDWTAVATQFEMIRDQANLAATAAWTVLYETGEES